MRQTSPKRRHDRPARRGRYLRALVYGVAALGVMQTAPCSPESIQTVIVNELTNQIGLEVFVAAETVLLNLFGI